MIISWLKYRKSMKAAAAGLYQSAVVQSRDPLFYENLGVADTMDGRFDLITMHVFLILERLRQAGPKGKVLSQYLFDHMFRHMELTLREMGIGDMGVPKHMKKMMKAFNGRVHSYHAALNGSDKQSLKLAVARNIYRAEGDELPSAAGQLAEYISSAAGDLLQQDVQTLEAGRVSFPSPLLQDNKSYA